MWCHLITVNIFLLIFVNRSNLILPVRQAANEGSKKFLAPRICKNHSSLASHKCDRCVEEKWAVSTYFYFDISSKRLLNWMLFIDSSCYNSKTQKKRTSKINVYYRSNRYNALDFTVNKFLLILVINRSNLILPVRQAANEGSKEIFCAWNL